ncbi:MAG: L-threonylcarbamoyladenylate synthase, partial [Firmicutes bacterium]|nr:L-threonylcarbamoyladenylate synthase [Bacillota bacterium]
AGIFRAKGRPMDNPLIVHISRLAQLPPLVSTTTPEAFAFAQAFWPGPLTMVLPGSGAVPNEVTAGLDTVAVRMPSHPVALALIEAAGIPVAAPSANVSGRPSPTTAAHVLSDLGGRIQMVVDGGPAGIGVESTVVDMTSDPPLVLRPGGATIEALRTVVPRIEVASDRGQQACEPPRSPGMKYRHYAPKADLWLFIGEHAWQVRVIGERVAAETAAGRRVGLLISAETARELKDRCAGSPAGAVSVVVGSREDLPGIASVLFDCMRQIDCASVDVILAESYATTGMGLAVMNRLMRAAGGRIIQSLEPDRK